MTSKFYFNQILKGFIFFIVFLALCSLQTVWWNQIFGSFPTPHLWITLIIFLVLRWPIYSGIFFSYFLGLSMVFYTYTPLKIIWISINFIYITIWALKNRITSTSLMLFGSLSAFASFLFSTLYYILSHILENRPTDFFILNRLTECGLTFLFSVPLYFLYNFLESLFVVQEKWQTQNSSLSENEDRLS